MEAFVSVPAAGDVVVKATAILALALLAVRALRRGSAAQRYLVITTGLAAAVLLPLVVLVVPRLAVPVLPAPEAAAEVPVGAEPLTPALSAATDWQLDIAVEGAAIERARDDGASPSLPRRRAPAAATPTAAPSPASALTRPAVSWPILLLASWLAGALLVAARTLLRRRRLRVLLRDAAHVEEEEWPAALRPAALRGGLRRRVMVLCSEALDVPVTFGVLHPRLVLPAAARDWSPARCRAVLDHELAHIRRLDALTQWIGEMAAVVYWFHPLVWIAIAQMRAQRERACDDHVLGSGARASDYARDLLEIASAVQPEARASAALAMARRSQLEGRLIAVLDPDRSRRPVSRAAALLVALGGLAVLVPIASLEAACASPRPMGSPAPLAVLAPAPDAPQAMPAPVAQDAPPAAEPSGDDSWPAMCALSGAKGHQNIHMSSDGDLRRRWHAVWSTGRCTLELEAEGRIVFHPDLSGIQSISPGGYLEVTERIGDRLRRLRVAPGPGGRQTYEYKLDGRARPFDEAGQRWLADFLLALERSSGFAADQRVPYLLQKGGPDGLLAEVGHLTSDYVRSRYLLAMLAVASLDEATLTRTMETAGRRIGSDYELARVLMATAGKYPLATPGARSAFLQAAGTIESDYERARVLMEILKRPDLNRDAARTALASAAALRSDYERARVLVAISDANLLDLSMQPVYIRAIIGMSSDYERARVLMDLMDRQKLTPDSARMAMKAASTMQSDYEKSRVLIHMVDKGLLPADQRRLYLDAVRGMKSDYERARSLIAALDRLELDRNAVLAVLDTASAIGSDHEKARVLVGLAGKVSLAGDARSAYSKVAGQIGSESERNRALAALAGD